MEEVRWLGHAGFMFVDKSSGQKIYYVDPFQIKDRSLEHADIIFVTHAHYDHLSSKDIDSLLKKETVVVATEDSLNTLNINQKKFPVEPNKSYEISGFKFETVPAYNIKPERLKYHPKENNWVGYIFTLNDKKIYHAGDTDFIPEMQNLASKNLDVAMLPIGGTYTMDVDDAINVANIICAKITIPMHYKTLLGNKAGKAEEKLKQGVTNSKVEILEELR